jgi:phosphoribosylanthranilate isomerase
MPRLKKPHWGIVLLTQASDSSFLLIKSRVVCLRDQKPLEATLQELSPFVDGCINDNFDSKTSASGATARRTTADEDRGPMILAGGLTAENVRRAILLERL